MHGMHHQAAWNPVFVDKPNLGYTACACTSKLAETCVVLLPAAKKYLAGITICPVQGLIWLCEAPIGRDVTFADVVAGVAVGNREPLLLLMNVPAPAALPSTCKAQTRPGL